MILLSILLCVFMIATAILGYYVYKFANIIFVIEDDLSEFHNRLLDINDRLGDVQRIRVLMSHPSANKYVLEALDELRYCDYQLLETVRRAKLIIKKDYSTIIAIDKDFPKLMDRLENNGIYDAEYDGGVNVIPVEELEQGKAWR